MAAALANEFTTCSFCDESLANTTLYACIVDDCSKFGEVFCEDCGIFSHKKKAHSFTFPNIKVIATKAMTKSMKKGSKKMACAVAHQREQKTVAARHAAWTVSCNVDKALNCIDGVMNVVMEMDINGTVLGQMTDTMTEVMKTSAEGAGYAALLMAAAGVVYHTVRYCKGDIESKKEYAYHVCKDVSAAVGFGVGNWGGGAIGAGIGSVFGPLGSLIGFVVGGIVGGLIGADLTRKGFDKLFEEKFGVEQEQTNRAQLIKEALNIFGYVSVNDIEKEDIFNKKELQKRYRERAKIYHPDRSTGSHQDFHRLNAALGCLLSLLQKDGKVKKATFKHVKQIQQAITW